MIIKIEPGIKIAQGDAKKLIKTIKNQSIDLILTDPPYLVSEYIALNGERKYRDDIKNAQWDNDFNPEDYAYEFYRILKPTGNVFIFTSHRLYGKWKDLLEQFFNRINFFVWHKTNPFPQKFKTAFVQSCELIICAWNKHHKWHFLGQNQMHNFIEGKICNGNERYGHPAQKPLYLLEHIIKITTDENDVVLDCFMGVGSTGVACKRLRRRFIGFEIDPEYFNIAKQRLINTPIQNHILKNR